MIRSLSRAGGLLGLLVGSALLAQQPGANLLRPQITSAIPPGARTGATIEVTVAGTDMDGDAPILLFSDPRIVAEYVAPPEPKADPKQKTPPAMPKKKGAPTGAVKFNVKVPADVLPGGYDVRMSSSYGVSNPRIFTVGTLPEVDEKEPNNDVPEAQKVELNSVVNGQISATTDVDYLQFAGKAGQRVLAHCAASSIDSKARPQLELYTTSGTLVGFNRNYSGNDALLDVVLPSDGDYLLRIAEFAYQFGGPENFYRLTLTTGPWVDAVFPPVVNPGKPAKVTVLGRNLPGGQPAAANGANRTGLQAVSATVTPPADANARTKLTFPGRVSPAMGTMDGFAYRFGTGSATANPVPVFFSDDPVIVESEKPNNTLETAQEVAAPANVVGRIDVQYDRDFYKFPAKKGDVFFLELFADRIGTGMDTYFVVRNDKGQDIGGEQDDDQDTIHPQAFFNRSGDPGAYKFTAPADGTYYVLVGSRESNVTYGPQCIYWLRIGKPSPDFRVIAMPRNRTTPDAINGVPKGEFAIDVFADRRDGFTGPITVTAENLPAGVTAAPAVIGTGAKWGTLVLSVGDNAKATTGPITVKCTADVAGKPLVREARPASVTWGVPAQNNNNTPTISRLDQQLILAIRPDTAATVRLAADIPTAKLKTKDKAGKDTEIALAEPIFVKPGDKLTLPVKLTWQDPTEKRANPLNVAMEDTHPGNQASPFTMAAKTVAIAKDKSDAPVVIDVKPNAVPGTYGLTFRGETEFQFARDPSQKDKKAKTNVAGYTKPITVTVLPTSVAKVSATPPGGNTLIPGKSADLVVKVERQFEYAGPFTVSVTFPTGTKGLTAKDVTIPAGTDEVKVPIAVDADFKPTTVSNVVITATATLHGKIPIAQEAKVNLTVSKAK